MAAQHHNKLNSCDLGSYCVLWMSSSYVCIFVKLYQRQSLEQQPGCSGQCRSSCVYLSTLDRPCNYETKHRTHLHEPQPSTSNQKAVYCLHKNHKYVVFFSLHFTDDPIQNKGIYFIQLHNIFNSSHMLIMFVCNVFVLLITLHKNKT